MATIIALGRDRCAPGQLGTAVPAGIEVAEDLVAVGGREEDRQAVDAAASVREINERIHLHGGLEWLVVVLPGLDDPVGRRDLVERTVERPLPGLPDHDVAPGATGPGVELPHLQRRALRADPLGHEVGIDMRLEDLRRGSLEFARERDALGAGLGNDRAGVRHLVSFIVLRTSSRRA
jgi:hypothetical protein